VQQAATEALVGLAVAAPAGAFAGAHHGAAAWPAEWVEAIEYRDRLLALGAAWDA
jgi:hypothetical protein